MKASIAIQIEPNQQNEREGGRLVDEATDYIRSHGLPY